MSIVLPKPEENVRQIPQMSADYFSRCASVINDYVFYSLLNESTGLLVAALKD